MMSFKNVILASSLFLSVSVQASVIIPSGTMIDLPADSLLENGGFEESEVDNHTWEYYTSSHNTGGVEGWDYDGSGMEIWDSIQGITSIEGEQHAELNAHGVNDTAYRFTQTFDTEVGETYDYGFAYKARNSLSESFDVEIMSINLDSLDDHTLIDHTTGDWRLFTGTFVATASESIIAFTSNDTLGDTTGNLLDAVYVTRSVPEPSSVLLLGLGLLGLGLRRRK